MAKPRIVESIGPKVYITDSDGSCIGRLCQISGEFWIGPEKTQLLTIPKCTFEQFQAVASQLLRIKVSDKNKPIWAV